MMKTSTGTKSIVLTAFFAAVIYLGIQAFRIPMPAAFGTPFLHFGHIFIMLAILCLGGKRATISGVLGLLLFDLLNGYLHSIPNVLFCTIVRCLLTGVVYAALQKKANGDPKKEYGAAVSSAVVYGVLSTVLDFTWSTVELMILGSTLQAALIAELASIPATAINGVFTVIGIAILFVPVKKAYCRVAEA